MDRGSTEDRVQASATATWWSKPGASARRRSRSHRVTAHLHKVLSDDAQDAPVLLLRGARGKERGIVERFGFDALTKLSHGLSKPRTHKRLDKVWQRIGRLKAQSRGVAQHYDVELDTDKTGQAHTAVRFTRRPAPAR